jgi:N-acetylglucosaminyl-diphospho-decaprenol L-rhamnosyltransferase
LSAVIVNFNTLELMKRCVECLPHSRELEILIVDNASTDGSREWLQTMAGDRIRCILSPDNLGFAGGCNLGIRQAAGNYILLLNTDAFPESGALESLVAYMEQCCDVGVAGPQLLFPDGRWQRSAGRVPTPRSALIDALGISSFGHAIASLLWPLTGRLWMPRNVGYVDGACMMIRRSVVEKIGGLNERLFFFVEDADYCMRARQNGWRVVHFPQSRVVHLRGGSSSQKNYELSVKMRARSERQFVLETQGDRSWDRLRFLRRLNFGWRAQFARWIGQRRRYERYMSAYRAYAEPSS